MTVVELSAEDAGGRQADPLAQVGGRLVACSGGNEAPTEAVEAAFDLVSLLPQDKHKYPRMLSGGMQIAFGLLKIGRYINYVPYPVISGFMSGIGLIIILLQLAPLTGHAAPEGPMLRKVAELPALLAQPVGSVLALGVITLLVVFLIPKRIARIDHVGGFACDPLAI